jgi:uncharacterized hydrophobic protein (TIGR00341 family)
MALRFLQIFVPSDVRERADKLLSDYEVLGTWVDESAGNLTVLHLVVPADETEAIMDRFEEAYADVDGFHVVMFAVAAALPRESDPEQNTDKDIEDHAEEMSKASRVSREELLTQVGDASKLDRVFVAMTLLSTIVAAVGLVHDDVAVIIGAMVIAPLLGPNMAMALSVTLGDWGLLRRATLVNVLGVSMVVIISVAIGLMFDVDESVDAIVARSRLGYQHLALAIAAGSAGTFAFTRGMSNAVIGVMVAVALMPPTVVFGMMLGAGQWVDAAGAAMLVVANVVGINLAGVATFVAQGVRPRSYFEEAQARHATRVAVAVWVGLFVALAGIIYWTKQSGLFEH